MDPERAVKRNLESWDARTPVHLRSRPYRRGIETLQEGGVTLLPPTDSEVGDVAGLRVLHLQCHIGLDTLSLSRLGANVTGLDFSPRAVEAARELSTSLDLPARFVVGDAQEASDVLAGETFDMVFASFGVLCWIPDVGGWMRSAASLLRTGGVLYVADGHPLAEGMEDDPDRPGGFRYELGYFDPGPHEFGPGPSYADDGSGAIFPETVEYTHTLGELVTSTCQAGLCVEFLHEFPGCFFQRCSSMIEGEGGVWDFPPPLAGKLPMVFSLRARKA